MNQALGIELPVDREPSLGQTDDLTVHLLDVVKNLDNEGGKPEVTVSQPLRSYFSQSGILVVRTGADEPKAMGAALKGGHNSEAHNHNDLGSYTLVSGKQKMVEDPGAIPYNIKTFGPERYTAFKSLGSYGHSVPLICGKDQISGSKARAIVTKTSFTEDRDEWDVDLSSAYDISQLKAVIRRFVFNRKQASFSVTDSFAFDSRQVFETAITTRSSIRIIDNHHIELERAGEKLILSIRSNAKKLSITTEEIAEGGVPYTRIAIRLPSIKKGFVTVEYDVMTVR